MKDSLILFTIIFIGLLLIYFHFTSRQDFRRTLELSNAEHNRILIELDKLAADDCVLERTATGYKCTETRTGRMFRIVEREALK